MKLFILLQRIVELLFFFRTEVAAMHFNENSGREVLRDDDEEELFSAVYKKAVGSLARIQFRKEKPTHGLFLFTFDHKFRCQNLGAIKLRG